MVLSNVNTLSGTVISYDFPLNERIRTLLRLEDLYVKIAYFSEKANVADHHAALSALFDILEVASRADLKPDLLQELERQKRHLTTLRNNPEISEKALGSVIDEIELASANLFSINGKIGQHLRDNDWLMSIKQRSNIPGGTCEFDLPSYHHWLHQDAKDRRNYIKAWLEPMLPICEALNIILKLLRESGNTHSYTAHHGGFQQVQGGRVAQLLRITIDSLLPCIPEVSANKYVLNVRFVYAKYVAKNTLHDEDVPFKLTFCTF